jgi:hypothetical protein
MVLTKKQTEYENIIATEKIQVETAGLPHPPDGFAPVEDDQKARGFSFHQGSVIAFSGWKHGKAPG